MRAKEDLPPHQYFKDKKEAQEAERTSPRRSIDFALKGALAYEKLGKGKIHSVKRRLLRAFEDFYTHNPDADKAKQFATDVRAFLERNSGDSGLEEKASGVMSVLAILLGFFFLSPNVTGAVLGAPRQSVADIFGVVLCGLGILVLFSFFSRR